MECISIHLITHLIKFKFKSDQDHNWALLIIRNLTRLNKLKYFLLIKISLCSSKTNYQFNLVNYGKWNKTWEFFNVIWINNSISNYSFNKKMICKTENRRGNENRNNRACIFHGPKYSKSLHSTTDKLWVCKTFRF